jgi:hypothetical protein
MNKMRKHNLIDIKGVSEFVNFLPVLSEESGVANIDATATNDDDDLFDLPDNTDSNNNTDDTNDGDSNKPNTDDEGDDGGDGGSNNSLELFDADGNQVDATGKVIKTKEELEAANNQTDDDDNDDDDDEGPVFYDKEGNQVNAKGEIVATKEDLEKAAFDKLPVIKQIQTLSGYEFTDEEGNTIEFEDTIEGIQEYTNKVAELKAGEIITTTEKEREQTTPDIVKSFENHIKSGLKAEDFFNSPLLNIQNVKLDKENTAQLKDIIRRDFEFRGMDSDRALKLIERSEAADELYEDAVYALKNLQQADKETETIKAQQVQKAQEAQVKAAQEQINQITSLVNKGNISNVVIPDKDRKQFLEYVTKPVKVENGQALTQYDIDINKAPLEEDLLRAFYHFKNYNLSTVVRDKVNTQKARTLTARLVKHNNPDNTISDSANTVNDIDFNKLP